MTEKVAITMVGIKNTIAAVAGATERSICSSAGLDHAIFGLAGAGSKAERRGGSAALDPPLAPRGVCPHRTYHGASCMSV